MESTSGHNIYCIYRCQTYETWHGHGLLSGFSSSRALRLWDSDPWLPLCQCENSGALSASFDRRSSRSSLVDIHSVRDCCTLEIQLRDLAGKLLHQVRRACARKACSRKKAKIETSFVERKLRDFS